MPPPPSQQGKFRPNKPRPKKKAIKPGAATVGNSAKPSASEASAPPTPSVAFSPSQYRDYGGRGGRGRRGRGRTPMPTGRVFFTGSDKKAGSTSTTRASGIRNNAGAATTNDRTKRKANISSTEEVVGQLDVAIGSSKTAGDAATPGKNSILDSLDFEEQDGEVARPTMTGQAKLNLDGVMYDSDSSEEEGAQKRTTQTEMAPLELPFAAESHPVGVGEAPRPMSYETPDAVASAFSPPEGLNDEETRASPFVSERDAEDVNSERDSWFLMQLPTRLPPLKQRNPAATVSMNIDNDEADVAMNPAFPTSSISEVVTQPVVTSGFDNVLLSAPPGRIGKIVVYRSGKTVLVVEGPNNSKVGFRNFVSSSC